jgi:hypothetical protein
MPRDIFIRSHRAGQVPPGGAGEMPPPRSFEKPIRNTIAVVTFAVIGGVLIWPLAGMAQHAAQDIAAVAERAVLYEEDPTDPIGKRVLGSAIWRTEEVPSESGKPSELAVRADIEFPARDLGVVWKLRRVTENGSATSHALEITFKPPPNFSSGGIFNVPGVWMKPDENVRGNALAGLTTRVTTGYFLIGLSGAPADKERNIQLLKALSWFEIPIIYTNNLRAILAMEKGDSGERAFAQAFAAWGK